MQGRPGAIPQNIRIEMLNLSQISLWGVVPLVVLLMASLAVFWLVDRRLFKTILRVYGLAMLQLSVVGLYTWLLLRADSWWAYGLWLSLLALAVGVRSARLTHLPRKKAAHVALAVALSVGVTCGLLLASLPLRLMLPVAAVLAAGIYESVDVSLCAYQRSYDNTQTHRYYLLANGATLLESLMPSVRRALRTTVMPQLRRLSVPLMAIGAMLFWGMIMGGATAPAALVVTLMLCTSAFVAAVMATLLAIYFLSKY